MKRTASSFLDELQRTVGDWCAERIDFETFNRRQRATWEAIRNAGPAIEGEVLRIVRAQLPMPGSRSSR